MLKVLIPVLYFLSYPFYNILPGMYSRKYTTIPRLQKEFTILCKSLGVSVVLCPFVVLYHFTHSMYLRNYITHLFVSDLHTYPLWEKFLFGIPIAWLALSIYSGLATYFIIIYTPIYTTIAMMSELKYVN